MASTGYQRLNVGESSYKTGRQPSLLARIQHGGRNHCDRIIEVDVLHERDNGAEELFAGYPHVRCDISEHCC